MGGAIRPFERFTMIIIKKGTNPSSFRLRNGNVLTFYPDVLTEVKDADFEALMFEYGKFITPRIISDKNPGGCFIVGGAKAADQNKEVGIVEDKSAPIKRKRKK